MRLALVSSGGFDRSGRERVVPALGWLVERLAQRHQVFVYTLRFGEVPCTYPLAGATVRDLGSPRGVVRQFSALAAAMRRDGPFDVVHGYLALPSGLMAALVGRRLRVPSVVTFDSGEFVGLPDIDYGLQLRRRHRLAVALTARLATTLTVCSGYQARLARGHGLAPLVIPLGVDTTRFRPDTAPKGPSDGSFMLLRVASLNRVKDQTTLLDAFKNVLERGIVCRLELVGEDTLGGETRDRVRRLALDRFVTFRGFQSSDALPALYRQADLFVLSSRHEGANVGVLEAAACGLASVGTSVGYLADWSPDRALAVPPRDPAALADGIVSLLRNPARRRRLAAAARDWTLAHGADWTARQFEDLYSQLSPHS
jgi:glycosyltransferase involved in cell wall biosynthesis